MSLEELKAAETREAARLAATAEAMGAGVLSRTTIAAAKAVLSRVTRSSDPGAVTADLRRLRTDPALSSALENDLRLARNQAAILIMDAMATGYRAEAEGHGDAFTGATVTVTIDRVELASYPLAGHTAPEIVDRLVATLRYEVEAAIALPLTGASDPGAIPAALGVAAEAHGARLGNAVSEAYFGATGAANKALAKAIVS